MNNGFMDMVGTLTGNIEKAVIAIQDRRDVQPKEKGAVEAGQQAANGTAVASLSKLNQIIDPKEINSSLSTALNVSNKFVQKSARIFTVQFNPSELQFSGYGGGFAQKVNFINDKEMFWLIIQHHSDSGFVPFLRYPFCICFSDAVSTE